MSVFAIREGKKGGYLTRGENSSRVTPLDCGTRGRLKSHRRGIVFSPNICLPFLGLPGIDGAASLTRARFPFDTGTVDSRAVKTVPSRVVIY